MIHDHREEAQRRRLSVVSPDMLRAQSALETCVHSIDPFNSAEIVMPEWSGVTFNPFLLFAYSITFLASAGLFVVEFWFPKARPQPVRSST